MVIMGIDPGRTSGVVSLEISDTGNMRIVEHGQVLFGKMPSYLDRRVKYADLLAVESFTITRRTLMLSRQNEALYVIGGAMFLARLAVKPLVLQTPADAKASFSDETLHDLGMFAQVTGPHARDALRHALLANRRHHYGL